ncbi:hypothetical protein ACP70R_023343 [Stipagrostis hirtigluma subsp. patula]
MWRYAPPPRPASCASATSTSTRPPLLRRRPPHWCHGQNTISG